MNIFVAKLSRSTNAAMLEALFRQYGEVDDVRIIYDRVTRESKKFGFVEMPSNREADTAIKTLNGQQFKGNTLQISEARQ